MPYSVNFNKLNSLSKFLKTRSTSFLPAIPVLPNEITATVCDANIIKLLKAENADYFVYNSCLLARKMNAFNLRAAALETQMYVSRDVTRKPTGISFGSITSNSSAEGSILAHAYYYGTSDQDVWLAHVRAFVNDMRRQLKENVSKTYFVLHFPLTLNFSDITKLLEPTLGIKHEYPPTNVTCKAATFTQFL